MMEVSRVCFSKYTLYTEKRQKETKITLKIHFKKYSFENYTSEEKGLGEDDGSEPSVPILVNGIAHPSTTVTKHKTFHIFNVNGKWVNGKW